MAGNGGIDGGCNVWFKFDRVSDGDRNQGKGHEFYVVDTPSQLMGCKEVTITLPTPIRQDEVGKKEVTRVLCGKPEKIGLRWKGVRRSARKAKLRWKRS